MKKQILERYEKSEDGRIIVDIAAEKVEDLYNNFDKRSNFLKKDLDEELSDYLSESVKEIGEKPFLIRITLAIPPEGEKAEKVKNSFQNYFLYMRELEVRKMAAMARTSLILLAVGIVILTFSILFNQQNEVWDSVIGSVFAEGLTVAAWVSLWEALATFLIQWTPHKKRIRLFESIAQSDLLFAKESRRTTPPLPEKE